MPALCAGGYGPDAIVGAVAYNYRIGTTEVTNSQYAEFLNAKAASDPFGLYNTFMSDGLNYGGITKSGPSGSYTYATIAGRGDMPVNWVTWYDSIRFANWLHNGQGSGDTETGAYTLLRSDLRRCTSQWRQHHPQRRRDVVPAQRERMVQGGVSRERRCVGQRLRPSHL